MDYRLFKEHLLLTDMAVRTADLYIDVLASYIEFFERTSSQEFAPAIVTPLDIKSYRQHLIDAGVRPATINNRLAALRTFFRWAQSSGLCSHNPCQNIKSVEQAPSAPRWLSRQEQYALLRAAEQECQLGDLRARGEKTHPAHVWPVRDRAIIALMLNTGLRISEVAALTIEDVQIGERSGAVAVRDGKGHKSRAIPLNKDARAALSAWLDCRPASGSNLFLSQKGGSMCTRAISARVTEIAAAAGLSISPHQLRHSFAKNLLDADVELSAVADTLGHTSLETTRRYTKHSQADLQAAVERVAWNET